VPRFSTLVKVAFFIGVVLAFVVVAGYGGESFFPGLVAGFSDLSSRSCWRLRGSVSAIADEPSGTQMRSRDKERPRYDVALNRSPSNSRKTLRALMP
jgi:hypothetical protein